MSCAPARNDSRLMRPASFLFPGRSIDKAIDPASLHAACRSATGAANMVPLRDFEALLKTLMAFDGLAKTLRAGVPR